MAVGAQQAGQEAFPALPDDYLVTEATGLEAGKIKRPCHAAGGAWKRRGVSQKMTSDDIIVRTACSDERYPEKDEATEPSEA